MTNGRERAIRCHDQQDPCETIRPANTRAFSDGADHPHSRLDQSASSLECAACSTELLEHQIRREGLNRRIKPR